MADLTKCEYEQLAAVHYALRRLMRQTDLEARRLGTTPQQHALLVAIKGYRGEAAPRLKDLAEVLQIERPGAIELVDRAQARGLVRREQDPAWTDHRMVQVMLTATGERLLVHMARALAAERDQMRRTLESITAE